MKKFWLVWMAALLVCAPAVFGQEKRKGEEQTRSVQGVVTTPEDAVATGAVVFLKNLKTLQIRSFITKENGTYYFHGLSPEVDYELRAEATGAASPTRNLSSFDSRREATVNLKLNKK